MIGVVDNGKLGIEKIDPLLLPAVRKVIQQMLAGGHKFPLDFNAAAKLACKDCYGAHHTDEQLSQATDVAIRMCGRTRRMT